MVHNIPSLAHVQRKTQGWRCNAHISPDVFVIYTFLFRMLYSHPTGPGSTRRPFMWILWASEWNLMGFAPNASVYPCNSSFLPSTTYSSITASDVCDRLDQAAQSLFVVGASKLTWHLSGYRQWNITCSMLWRWSMERGLNKLVWSLDYCA